MRLLSLDGAMHNSGISVFDRKTVFDTAKLTSTELIKVPSKTITETAVVTMIALLVKKIEEYNPDIVVAEIQKPQHKGERMSTQALMHLAAIPLGVLGYCASQNIQVVWYQPMSWKGNVPKEILKNRIMENEKKLKTKSYLYIDGQSDIIDSIGLGRFALTKGI